MGITSKTGLIASVVRPVRRNSNSRSVNLETIATPAPYILRPLAGLYNPFPYACSLLCNHPAPSLPPGVYLNKNKDGIPTFVNTNAELSHIIQQNSVPEELFRRYTETDSRPLTPAPTTTSTTTNVNRRCITPEPVPRPKLVVDLRRTHSQETLSWTLYSEQDRLLTQSGKSGQSTVSSPPSFKQVIIKKTPSVMRKPTKASSPDKSSTLLQADAPLLIVPKSKEKCADDSEKNATDKGQNDDDGTRRRGKKKRVRDSSKLATSRNSRQEPETQIASMTNDAQDSDNGATVNESSDSEPAMVPTKTKPLEKINSFLEPATIKHLQRELNKEVIDIEFDSKRKVALEEAFRCRSNRRDASAPLTDWCVPPTDVSVWLTLPRAFSRSTARFELPLDSRELEKMTPLQYVQQYVIVTNARKLLYNCLFNRHRESTEDDEDRFLIGKNISRALNEAMGKPLSEKQSTSFRGLLDWRDDDSIDFRTWCGICALCERILAPELSSRFLGRDEDPGNEMERADFESLPRKLIYLKLDDRLRTILLAIKDL